MPKLSIITINLNNVRGLEKTIKSVVSQTYTDYEYIIIDGGSTDGSVDVIKKYSDKITYWISEPDTGIYNAMNKGILKATGEYCQFLNSGDRLVSDNVTERMLSDIPDCSILYGNMLKTIHNGKIFRDVGAGGKPITLFNLYRSTINHSTALIKKTLFDKYGLYDENLKIVSDWKFYLIAVGLNNEPVEYTDLDISIFDLNGISVTNTNLLKKERRFVLEQMIQKNILADYDEFAKYYHLINRINEYKIFDWIIRVLNKCVNISYNFKHLKSF